MDQVVDKLAALGVPALVLVVAMGSTGLAGAAAITTALALLGGPFGMLGGMTLLGAIGLVSKGLASMGQEALFRAILDRLQRKGLSIDEIRKKVDGYWALSPSLKAKLKRYLDQWGPTGEAS